jgi:hypothetical protein
MVEIKFSRTMMGRIVFQSDFTSPYRKKIASKANLTGAGGLLSDFNSTKCCFLMPLMILMIDFDI